MGFCEVMMGWVVINGSIWGASCWFSNIICRVTNMILSSKLTLTCEDHMTLELTFFKPIWGVPGHSIYHYLSLLNLPVFCKLNRLAWKIIIYRRPLGVNLKDLFSFQPNRSFLGGRTPTKSVSNNLWYSIS